MKKLLIPFIILVFVTITACIIVLVSNLFSTENKRGDYEGDLIPLKKEIENIDNYEIATNIILENLDRIYQERETYDATNYIAGLISYQRDSLKLRFLCRLHSSYNITIEDSDTTIIFSPDHTDYYLRSNKKNGAIYTQFEHSIIYTTKPKTTGSSEDTGYEEYGVTLPNTVIKIKDRFYYVIRSSVNG